MTWAKKYSYDNNLKVADFISNEYQEILLMKDNFEKSILEEIKFFDKKYSHQYFIIISEFVGLINNINEQVK